MDPNAIAGMIFTLILAIMAGGFILLFPLSRRLGALLESRIHEKRSVASDTEIARLTEVVLSLQKQVQSLVDRQDFVEHLLQAERPSALLGEGATEARLTDEAGRRQGGR